MVAKRKMTPEEREQLYQRCYESKLGSTRTDSEYFWKLQCMDPEGYSEVSRKAHAQAIEDYKGRFRC